MNYAHIRDNKIHQFISSASGEVPHFDAYPDDVFVKTEYFGDPYRYSYKDGCVVERPECPNPLLYDFNEEKFSWERNGYIDHNAKRQKKARQFEHFAFKGKHYQADAESQRKMQFAALTMGDTIKWKCVENTIVVLTRKEFYELCRLIAERTAEVYI